MNSFRDHSSHLHSLVKVCFMGRTCSPDTYHSLQNTDGSIKRLRGEMFWCDSERRSTNQSNVVLNDLLQLLTLFFMLQGMYGHSRGMLGV